MAHNDCCLLALLWREKHSFPFSLVFTSDRLLSLRETTRPKSAPKVLYHAGLVISEDKTGDFPCFSTYQSRRLALIGLPWVMWLPMCCRIPWLRSEPPHWRGDFFSAGESMLFCIRGGKLSRPRWQMPLHQGLWVNLSWCGIWSIGIMGDIMVHSCFCELICLNTSEIFKSINHSPSYHTFFTSFFDNVVSWFNFFPSGGNFSVCFAGSFSFTKPGNGGGAQSSISVSSLSPPKWLIMIFHW